jgi:hypothetical protein
MRRAGVHPVVISDILGHAKVDLAMNAYDHVDDLRQSLAQVTEGLFRDVPKTEVAASYRLKTKWDGERGRNRTFNLLFP